MATPPPPPPPAGGGVTPGAGSIPARSFGDIFSAAFELYKANFTKLIGIVAIVVVPLAIIQAFVTKELLFDDLTLNTTTGEIDGGAVGGGFATSLFLLFITFLVQFILNGAIARAAAGATLGEPITAERVYKFGLSRMGAIIWVSLLSALAILGGLILFIIPGIIIAVKLSVAVQSLVVENKRGTEALSRSWNLTKNYFWPVLGIVIVTGIITGIVSSLVAAPFGSNWYLSWIGTSIGQIITVPFAALVYVIMYLDLRVKKENLDIATLQNDMRASAV